MLGLGKKAKKLKSKAENTISDIRNRESTEDKELNDVENKAKNNPKQAESEEEESVQREKDIVDEIRSAESDLESLLRLDEDELKQAFEYFADSIKLERKEDEKIKVALENLREIDENLDRIYEEFSGSFKQYRKDVLKQFKNENIDVVIKKAKKADPENSDTIAPGMQGMAAGFLTTELDRIESEINPDENLVNFLRREGKEDEKIVKMADWYNQVLWTLDGRQAAVEKPRYESIREELQEVVELKKSAKKVAEEFKELREFENKIKKDVDAELENLPEDLKQMEQIGEDLVALKKEIDRTELEEKELVKIEKNTSVESHTQAHSKIRSEVANIEDNLSNLEAHIDKLAEEVAQLESKDEQFEQLDERESEELKEILDREEGMKQLAEKLREEWVDETNVLFGEASNTNYQNSSERDIKKEISDVLKSIEELAQIIDTEAMRLEKYSRKEYEEAEKFRKFSKDWFKDIESEMEEAGLSMDANMADGSKAAPAD